MQIPRDESGVVLDWLAKIVVGLALVGVVLFDAGAVAVNFFGLDSTADDIATALSTDISASGSQMTAPQLQANAKAMAKEAGARLVRAEIDPEGILHVKVRRRASTLLLDRVDALKGYGRAVASSRATTR